MTSLAARCPVSPPIPPLPSRPSPPHRLSPSCGTLHSLTPRPPAPPPPLPFPSGHPPLPSLIVRSPPPFRPPSRPSSRLPPSRPSPRPKSTRGTRSLPVNLWSIPDRRTIQPIWPRDLLVRSSCRRVRHLEGIHPPNVRALSRPTLPPPWPEIYLPLPLPGTSRNTNTPPWTVRTLTLRRHSTPSPRPSLHPPTLRASEQTEGPPPNPSPSILRDSTSPSRVYSSLMPEMRC